MFDNFGLVTRKAISGLIFFCLFAVTSLANAQSYVVNGVGEYLEFNETTLLIKLELESPASDALEAIAVDTNKKLSFRIMQDKSPRLWSRIWIQNLSINNSPETITNQTNDLIAMTRAIKGSLVTGDLVEFERIASDLTILRINGNEIEDYETPEFFEFLLSAFIGSIPPSSELKAELLSGGDINNDANTLFESMRPSSERIVQIASWAAPTVSAPEPQVEEPTEPEQEVVIDTIEAEDEEVVEAQSEVIDEAAEIETAATEVIEEPEQQVVEETAIEEPIEEIVEDEDAPILITAESLLAAQNYQRSVLASVYQNINYPSSAVRRNREGSLRLAISINENGSLSDIQITQNARYDVFDEAAIEAVEDAAPFGDLPDGTLEIPMVLEIPIAFRLQ